MRHTFTHVATWNILFVLMATGMPVNPMPSIVANSQEGIHFLWNEVQSGILHKALPTRYASLERDWHTFLVSTGYGVVSDYYRADIGIGRRTRPPAARKEFVKLLRGATTEAMRLEGELDHRKEVAELLVEAFANEQKDLRDALELRAQHARQMSEMVQAYERRLWGQDLRLGTDSSDHRP